jgi:hypothetical protein
MANFTKLLLVFSLSVILSCQSVLKRDLASDHHISQNAQQLVTWETKANAVSTRSNQVIRLEHYEIPLRLLQQDVEETLDQNMKDSLIFEKNGEKYVRWVINPEDTKWHFDVKNFLEKHNLDSEPRKFFDAYLTASRSMILVNPDNGATFSLKVSTNKTGGNWTDKKQTWVDAQQVRNMDKWMSEVTSSMKTEHLVIMNEPFAMGIKEIDHGMIMRSLNDVPKDEHFYLPGFSVLHEAEGARIAKLNGAKNVSEFWDKHYNQPLAKALAEFFAYTGAWYDSPHSQNFLVELDKNMKPTGRIILRDLGDTYLLEDFAINTKYAKLTALWEDGNVHKGKLNSAVGLLHGNSAPSWMSDSEYQSYAKNFYTTFEKKFSEISNIPEVELRKTPLNVNPFSYATKNYSTTSESWKNYLKYANCLNGEAKTLAGLDCPEFYLKKQKKIDCYNNVVDIIMAH